MEIKIDLQDVLRGEYGSMESFGESIHRQVVDTLTVSLKKGIEKKIDKEIDNVIQEQIKKVVECQMPSLLSELIDKEYTRYDKWGGKGETTTIRNQLIKTLTESMVYKEDRYDSDKNYFTRNVDNIMKAKMEEFKNEFNTHVDKSFIKEAFDYAVDRLRKHFE